MLFKICEMVVYFYAYVLCKHFIYLYLPQLKKVLCLAFLQFLSYLKKAVDNQKGKFD